MGELAPEAQHRRDFSVLLSRMNCGFSWRPPRRTAFAGRLVLLACLLALAFGLSAGPASAYPCKSPQPPPAASGERTLTGHVDAQEDDCEPDSEARAPAFRRRNADPMSFVFFIGILVAVVLVPVAFGRREELPPE
jgi:hypothetical protein